MFFKNGVVDRPLVSPKEEDTVNDGLPVPLTPPKCRCLINFAGHRTSIAMIVDRRWSDNTLVATEGRETQVCCLFSAGTTQAREHVKPIARGQTQKSKPLTIKLDHRSETQLPDSITVHIT